MGIESSVSPFLKMSFETATHFLTDATLKVRRGEAGREGLVVGWRGRGTEGERSFIRVGGRLVLCGQVSTTEHSPCPAAYQASIFSTYRPPIMLPLPHSVHRAPWMTSSLPRPGCVWAVWWKWAPGQWSSSTTCEERRMTQRAVELEGGLLFPPPLWGCRSGSVELIHNL